ncbi:MFS transporter [Halorarius litoreus]|uniref:MFS transporter n=1 Tax=Halorarius litoreus TaxID=2962676 RepID=UPI0020CEA125|nr:MFS transporter [Halorarius litoreus]
MYLLRFLRDGDWAAVGGYLLYVGLLAGGYYYNVTFVQLGVLDLGTRLVGLSRPAVSTAMAGLALVTAGVAIGSGVWMDRSGTSRDLFARLRLTFGVVVVQFLVALVAPHIRSVPVFLLWLAVSGVTIGLAVPVAFSLMVDFVPVPDRGYAAAAAAGGAFFAAALYPLEWRIGAFSTVMVVAMLPALPLLGAAAYGKLGFVNDLAARGQPYADGRFTRGGASLPITSIRFLSFLVLLFGVFFVDSFGFLRIVEEPALVEASWQSPDLGVHATIAVVHLVGAGMAGVLYANFEEEWLFLWTFAVFAVTHLLYAVGFLQGPIARGGLAEPLFYALAVSFYTTLNFALWPDTATPEGVGTRAAVGVGAAWLATFLSTALALYLKGTGLSVPEHFDLVNALALLLLLATLAMLYVRRAARAVGASGEVVAWR